VFEDLLAALQLMSTQDVKQATLDELEDVCKNPVFRFLCEICDVLHPRKEK